MAMFQQKKDPTQDVMQLRQQGLTDSIIMEELTQRGYSPDQIHAAISSLNQGFGDEDSVEMDEEPPAAASPRARAVPAADSEGNIYERIEEIAESMIDEKWDELIEEVKKIVEWKEKVEAQQTKIIGDVQKLKEDFTILHQGVLGKLEDYDVRMRDVGTELNAVGKIFKDVVPQFVENVKELSSITSEVKEKVKK